MTPSVEISVGYHIKDPVTDQTPRRAWVFLSGVRSKPHLTSLMPHALHLSSLSLTVSIVAVTSFVQIYNLPASSLSCISFLNVYMGPLWSHPIGDFWTSLASAHSWTISKRALILHVAILSQWEIEASEWICASTFFPTGGQLWGIFYTTP